MLPLPPTCYIRKSGRRRIGPVMAATPRTAWRTHHAVMHFFHLFRRQHGRELCLGAVVQGFHFLALLFTGGICGRSFHGGMNGLRLFAGGLHDRLDLLAACFIEAQPLADANRSEVTHLPWPFSTLVGV